MVAAGAPVRPVAVLDACVLVPPGLRDLLLWCAHLRVFRPLWQDEILDEVHRNGARLVVESRGLSQELAEAELEGTLSQMNLAFPDACADLDVWVDLVQKMVCDPKDAHVLAIAVGAGATHLVTENIRDFPVAGRPPQIAIVRPDRFMLDRLATEPELVMKAVQAWSASLRRPPMTPVELATRMANGHFTPRFGEALLEILT